MWRDPRSQAISIDPQGFTNVDPIARGGTGDVLRAWQTAMGRTVALKVYTAIGGSDCADRELAVAGWLGVHPHLVTVHGRGLTPSGHDYVVMPWYDGGSLADEVRRRGPLPVAEVLCLGVKLAGALAHLHGHSVIHRDIKPANVLLTGAGEPILADLGLATLPGEPQGPAASLTPLHAAPEVLRGEPSTPRSDVWSLVSTLCTILDRSNIPLPLSDLLAAATCADPDQRPADGGVLATGLQAVQEQLGLPVTHVPAVPGLPSLPAPPAPSLRASSSPAPVPSPEPSSPIALPSSGLPLVSPSSALPLPAPPSFAASSAAPSPPSPSLAPPSSASPFSGPPAPGSLFTAPPVLPVPEYLRTPGSSSGGETVLRNPPPVTRRNPWLAIAAGTLAGTVLAVLVLTLASLLHLW